jgi:membrane protease YdiL (CAAX protease family)
MQQRVECEPIVNPPRDPPGIHCRAAWLRLLLGLSLISGLFQWSASALRSDRGQAGIVVGTLIVAAAIAVERALFGDRLLIAARALGLGRPRARGLVVACAVSLLLFLVMFVFVGVTEGQVSCLPYWISLLTGLFAQAGVVEETLFRGYLFRHLRVTRSFWLRRC